MRQGIWQTVTASLAIGCLTMGAAAQFDAEDQQQDEAAEQQPQQVEDDRGAFGQEADQEGELRIGTVDLAAVSEAYNRHKEARDAERGADATQDDDDAGLQEPAEADQADPLGEGPQDQHREGGVDREMIDSVREKAREVAAEEGVQMIVLEVLHGEDAGVQTVDLTDRVIERIERGDDHDADALMGIGADEETEDADVEQDEESDAY